MYPRIPLPRSAASSSSRLAHTLLFAFVLLLCLAGLLSPLVQAADVARISRSLGSDHVLAAARQDAAVPLLRRDSTFLCKCTCFGTNTTLVPLFAPQDPSKPCTTCTKQFCLDTLGSAPACKGARIQASDGDTGTGWEGDVWAKCFQRDSGKDRNIVLLYVLTVLGLLLVAALRQPLSKAYEEYRANGPSAMLRSITSNAPWYQSSQRARMG